MRWELSRKKSDEQLKLKNEILANINTNKTRDNLKLSPKKLKQDEDVEIGDDGVKAFLSGGLELFPAERNWHGEKGWDEEDEEYQWHGKKQFQ